MFIPRLRSLPEWDPNDPNMKPYDEIEETLSDDSSSDNGSIEEYEMNDLSPDSSNYPISIKNENIFLENDQAIDDEYLLPFDEQVTDFWNKSEIENNETIIQKVGSVTQTKQQIQTQNLTEEQTNVEGNQIYQLVPVVENQIKAFEGGNMDAINPQLVQQFVVAFLEQRREIESMRNTIAILQNMIAQYAIITGNTNNNSSPLPSPVGGSSFEW